MGLYLVVAHQTAGSPELLAKLSDIAASDQLAEFVLLVPASPIRHLLTWTDADSAQAARTRASEAAQSMRKVGLNVIDTVVGAADPMQAIEDEHHRRARAFDATIISTLPVGVSRWLGRDLPNQARRKLREEVIHVVSRPPREAMAPRVEEPAPGQKPAGEPLSLAATHSALGHELYCLDGEIGKIDKVLYDYVSGDPVWLGIASRPIPFRTLLVPALVVRLNEGRITVPLHKQTIMSQPHCDVGEGIPSLTDEDQLYHHFGLPFDGMRDLRVLHHGQALPGTQVNWQNIFGMEERPRSGAEARRE